MLVLLKKTGFVSASCECVEVELLRERKREMFVLLCCVWLEKEEGFAEVAFRVMKQCRESERKRIVFCFVLFCFAMFGES